MNGARDRLMISFALTMLTAAGMSAPPARAVDIVGAGATFPYPIYARWAQAYRAETGVGLNYQSIGSGGGIKQIRVKTVAFGASDKPLQAAELEKDGLLQFPMIVGGVVPVANVEGVAAGQLKLTGSVLAEVYLGKITRWNDPALAALNRGLSLPDQAITVVYRSDGSGTTFIFTHYLSQMSAEWQENVGSETQVAWPVGVGGKGNEGVASYVSRIRGAIGYIEHAYAFQNRLDYALLQNRAGEFVTPSSASFAAAAANADWSEAPDFYLLLTDQPGEASWPVTGASFILMHKQQDKPDVAREVLSFFDWAYRHGGAMAGELDYVPIPDGTVDLIESTWAEIEDPAGKAVWGGPR